MKVAGAPISWGVCEVPGWGFQADPHTVLSDMTTMGLKATEFGPYGWLPVNPSERATMIANYGLSAVGTFVPLILFESGYDPIPDVERELLSLKAAGGDVLVVAAASGIDGYDERPLLNNAEWGLMLSRLDQIKEIVEDRGLAMSVHPHVGTMIESKQDVLRVLEGSRAHLCLDTGHLLIGGSDPAELTIDYASRVNHVHVKDVLLDFAQQVQSGKMTYTRAVAGGMYVPIGQGDVDFVAILNALTASNYDGWFVMEQDRILSDEAGLAEAREDILASLGYLRNLKSS